MLNSCLIDYCGNKLILPKLETISQKLYGEDQVTDMVFRNGEKLNPIYDLSYSIIVESTHNKTIESFFARFYEYIKNPKITYSIRLSFLITPNFLLNEKRVETSVKALYKLYYFKPYKFAIIRYKKIIIFTKYNGVVYDSFIYSNRSNLILEFNTMYNPKIIYL